MLLKHVNDIKIITKIFFVLFYTKSWKSGRCITLRAHPHMDQPRLATV